MNNDNTLVLHVRLTVTNGAVRARICHPPFPFTLPLFELESISSDRMQKAKFMVYCRDLTLAEAQRHISNPALTRRMNVAIGQALQEFIDNDYQIMEENDA
jgi:hypothetical protein